MTVDTACSSSLVALHLACAALRQGECDLALAGGVQVMSTPATFVEFSRLRGLAPDGRCKAFSASADGVGWSEGCGVLVLKRLSDADRAGDRVLALVRGSAVNQDGRSQGLTAPNGPSQQRVIRRALAVSGLAPNDIDAVEAHGTGTTLGDPIEAGALAEVFGPTRQEGAPLHLGSSKSNLGHTSAAAGVLGVIKMVLALQHEQLPKTLHAETPSEHIAWQGSGLSLLLESRPWPRRAGRPRRAGVSGFGVSGTNAHVILEETPVRAVGAAPSAPAPLAVAVPLLVSGRDEAALKGQARRWAAWLAAHPDVAWPDVLRTAALHRTHFPRRAALFVEDVAQATNALSAVAEGCVHAAVTMMGHAADGPLAVLFTGQGSQRAGMGRALYGRPGFEAFTRAFDAAAAACDINLDQSLRQVMWPTEWECSALLDQTRYAQPALFALEVALFRQCQGWGVRPQMVLGHSVGELVCAHLADVMSLADAAELVCARGRLMHELATSGGQMASVEASEAETRSALAELSELLRGSVEIACVNTPKQTVVSGDGVGVAVVVRHFDGLGRKSSRLSVSHAFHSAHMDGMLEAFRTVAERLVYQPPTLTVVSNVTGQVADLDRGDLVTADYWVRHVRQAVRFAEGVHSAVKAGARTFLECGPHGVLCAMLAECVSLAEEAVVATLPMLRKGHQEPKTIVSALGGLHVHGHRVDWDAMLGGTNSSPAALPTYAFERQRYWFKPKSGATDVTAAGLSRTAHPFLGAATSLAESDGELFTGRLSLSAHPWLADHKVFDTVVMPGTGIVELALAAGLAVGSPTVLDLTLSVPLGLPAKGGVRVQVRVEAADAQGRRAFTLHSQREGATEDTPWVQHVTGVLGAAQDPALDGSLEAWPPQGATPLDLTDLYAWLSARGLRYGPAFQGLTAAWRDGSTLYGQVALAASEADAAGDYGLHPALFDAAFHVLAAAQKVEGPQEAGSVLLPFSWSNVALHAMGAGELRVRVDLSTPDDSERMSASIAVCDGTGQRVATVGTLSLRRATAEQVHAAVHVERRDLYRVNWQPVPLAPWKVASDKVVVVGGEGGLANVLGISHVADVGALRSRLDAGETAAERVIFDKTSGPGSADVHEAAGTIELPAAVQAETTRALVELQALLSDARLAKSALVWVTSSAIGTGAADGVGDLVRAPLWGLLRSARHEHPERVLRLVDVDGEEPTAERLWPLLVADAEPELAWRQRKALAARLQVVGPADAGSSQAAPALEREGTVLITGGMGELGQALARHLVSQHGVRHLVLTSRRGRQAPGADELVMSLLSLGAETVDITACDVGERSDVLRVLDAMSPEHPLTGVFHLAGVLDDGVVSELTAERLGHVLRPKVNGAWHLHELTKGKGASAFVMFSSAAGVMGNPGQANYAAANAFLDALAARRHEEGLPGQALAWGLWESEGVGMTARLGAAKLARMRRAGLRPIPVERGMALLDEALARAEVGLVAMHLDLGAVQRRVGVDARVPALFRTLVRPGLRRVGARGIAAGALRRRLPSLAEKDRLEAVVAMVQEVVAAVLGLAGAAAVPSSQPLKELGLDSLMAVEIRNQLSARAETTLPVTLVFDYPTPQAIATLLLEKLGFPSAPVWSDSQIRTKLSRISIPALRQMGLVDALMQQPEDLTSDELLEYPADAIDKMDRQNVLQALDLLFR